MSPSVTCLICPCFYKQRNSRQKCLLPCEYVLGNQGPCLCECLFSALFTIRQNEINQTPTRIVLLLLWFKILRYWEESDFPQFFMYFKYLWWLLSFCQCLIYSMIFAAVVNLFVAIYICCYNVKNWHNMPKIRSCACKNDCECVHVIIS